MVDFTTDEVAKLKKQLTLNDLYSQRDELQETKSKEIEVIRQKCNADIDTVNANYNPQIDSVVSQIKVLKDS